MGFRNNTGKTWLLFFLSWRSKNHEGKMSNLTWPPPLSLLVSFTLLKETGAFIQCAPKFGESGWMYTQLGVWGSGLPPGTHSPFTYFHLWLSADTKSSRTEYMAFGSNPETFTFSTGNMRLDKRMKDRNKMVLLLIFIMIYPPICLSTGNSDGAFKLTCHSLWLSFHL